MNREEVDARYLDVLAQFVIRARRLEAHSLSAWEHLPLVHTGGFDATARKGQPLTVTTYLPDEEQLESAAARARPLFLKKDPIHYSKVMSAIGYFTREHPDTVLKDKVQRCKDFWVRTEDPVLSYYVGGQDDEPPMTDKVLFEGWLYGDLIHAGKDDQKAAEGTTLQERFQAATTMITRVFATTATTLRLVKECEAAGLFTIPESAYQEPVSVTTGTIEQHQIIYIDTPETHQDGDRDDDQYQEWRTGIFVHRDAWDDWLEEIQERRKEADGVAS